MTDSIELEKLRRTIWEMDQRLERIESLVLGVKPAAPSRPPPPIPTVVVDDRGFPMLGKEPVAGAIEPLTPPMQVMPLEPLPPPRERRSLEATIGLNWTGWIGAIVFVLGVLFFLKYAWDQGWVHPTPTMRVIAAILIGIGVSVGGEWMHRKRVRVLAATLHGAGIAIVMAGFFGAYALFNPSERVLGLGGAMAGVAITAMLGIAIALHIDMVVLAIIAMLGAYLAPFVLNTGEDRSPEFLTYIGVLAAVGWNLCYFKPSWSVLRGTGWAATFLSFAAWWFNQGEQAGHIQPACIALAVYFAGFLGEMVLTLRKSEPDEHFSTAGASAAVLSLLNTAATFGMLYAVLEGPGEQRLLGWIAIGLALIHAGAAFATGVRAFSVSSLLQSAVLLTLAVPLLMDQYIVTLSWLALAGALTVVAWELNIPAARGWAIVLLLLAVGRLVIFDGRLRGSVALSVGTFSISRWTMLAWGIAAFAHIVAWLRPGSPGRIPALERRFARMMPTFHPLAVQPIELSYATPTPAIELRGVDVTGIFASAIGSAIFLGASVTGYHGSILTLLGLLWLVPMIALAGHGRNLLYSGHAAVIGALVAIKWFWFDGVQPIAYTWNSSAGSGIPPILNLVALNGAILCALLVGLITHARRDAAQWPQHAGELVALLALVVLAMLNFEACRFVDQFAPANPGIVKHVVMSVLWGATGFVAVGVGFRRNIAPFRYAALALLGVTLLKIFVIDMAEVKAIWRILSFVATGVLLLGVSYLYHRQIERRESESVTPS